MRREWIDEERRKVSDHPKTSRERDVLETQDLPTRLSSDQNATAVEAAQEAPGARPSQVMVDTTDPDLFMPDPEGMARPPAVSQPEPDDDDLDDLLREQDEVIPRRPEVASGALNNVHDSFDAEYEAMNELGM